MNKSEALKTFKDQITVPCPREDCGEPIGELCDSPTVWIHLERFHASEGLPSIEKDLGVKYSPYRVIFNEANRNWTGVAEHNMLFLKCQQNYLNDRLRARDFLFLNEVYEALGFCWTPEGQLVGWTTGDASRDKYIGFNIFDSADLQLINHSKNPEDDLYIDFNMPFPIIHCIN